MTSSKKSRFYVVLVVILASLGIIPFVCLHPFVIGSGDMMPTILMGDRLFASKMTYIGEKPRYGDVSAFSPAMVPNTYFIRRVVGLPGDKIQMKGGILHINDVPCAVEFAGEFETVNHDGTVLKASQYTETLPNGKKHLILKKDPFGVGTYDNTPVYKVPAGHYFMMGDNRDGSNDSRTQGNIGYIPLENFIGRASFIYFSAGEDVSLWEIWKWPSAAHYHRIFQGIH